jgi:Putative transposase
VLQLKSAFKDGTTHILMSPLEFMQRLAALVLHPNRDSVRRNRDSVVSDLPKSTN